MDTTEIEGVSAKTLRVQRSLDIIQPGATTFEIDGNTESAPEECKAGFGTWHPRKNECVTCMMIPLCFCKATDTKVVIAEVARRSSAKKKSVAMSVEKDKLEPKEIIRRALNPWTVGTRNYYGRELYIKLTEVFPEDETHTFSTLQDLEDFAVAHDIKRVKTIEESVHLWAQQLWKYSEQKYKKGAPSKCEELFLTVTLEGKLPTSKITVNLTKAREALDRMRDKAVPEYEQIIAVADAARTAKKAERLEERRRKAEADKD